MTDREPPPAAGTSRLGIDLGGTKIEGRVLSPGGEEIARRRILAPQGDYDASVRALTDIIGALMGDAGGDATVGIAMPGSLSPSTGLVRNANSTWLNGRPLRQDLEAALGRPVRMANDANCFALSEAVDGAAAGARSVFGVIVGTGCGGGIVIDGKVLEGARGIGGEWGHNPLPWADADEHPGAPCWCGRNGCMEIWASGTGLSADYRRRTGELVSGHEIVERAHLGEPAARTSLDRHASRLARGLAHIVNVIDPDVIVLGGGLSKLPHLYEVLPKLAAPYVFSDVAALDIRPPKWGDASGVRGAAWLWNT
ncbi:MAG: ROK family protein [Hyphomicrobium sp.]|jgi:fructokinase|uniref:ROK family protein n=1 Tax=Hyphomicrobium sp. TaxID=82 RepID=UPI0025C08824|nr:ROK family protein [Hyphomicrobium sp.]MBX9862962.1 ROK family protein [Hyphomicrobium sp.]